MKVATEAPEAMDVGGLVVEAGPSKPQPIVIQLGVSTDGGSGKSVIMEDRLWLTEDKAHLVPDGHPKAAFLFCIPGQRVLLSEAVALGLEIEDEEDDDTDEDTGNEDTKSTTPDKNKQRTPARNK